MNLRTPSIVPSIAAAALLLAACKSSNTESAAEADAAAKAPARVELKSEYTATAQVVSVERADRILTLRREDGSLLVVQVGATARNFDQVVPGDAVRIRYAESLAAERRPAGDTSLPAVAATAAGRTEAGAKPGAGIGAAASVRVKVESIDLAHDLIVCSLASGELVAHRFATSQGRQFAKGLKVGDVVQLDYDVAVALSVEEL